MDISTILSEISSSQSSVQREPLNLIVIQEDEDPVTTACLNFNTKPANSKLTNDFHFRGEPAKENKSSSRVTDMWYQWGQWWNM